MTSRHEIEASQRATLSRVFPGGSFSEPRRLSGGVSAGATRWDVVLPTGERERVVVRAPTWGGSVSRARLVAEAKVLQLLEQVPLAAPRLLGLDVNGERLVLEFVEGQPCFTRPFPEAAITQLARTLVAIHQVTPRRVDLGFLPRRDESVEALLTQAPDVLDEKLGEARVRRASSLRPTGAANAPVLLHGDYWPGNVVWNGDELSAVIDWEEAEVGDPLSDLAIARLDLLWAFGREVMERFTELYVSSPVWAGRLVVDDLAWWDLVAALRPMSNLQRWASAYPPPPIHRPDITVEYMAEMHGWFVERALQRWSGDGR